MLKSKITGKLKVIDKVGVIHYFIEQHNDMWRSIRNRGRCLYTAHVTATCNEQRDKSLISNYSYVLYIHNQKWKIGHLSET